MYEIRRRGVPVLYCESRPHAERLVSALTPSDDPEVITEADLPSDGLWLSGGKQAAVNI